MPSSFVGGPHELGQNLLVDRAVINRITQLVARNSGPIVELGPGDGAVTVPLARSGRVITAVELDPKRARRLHRRTPEHVTVVNDDMLRFRLPQHPHVLVGNLPFHLTTPLLRRLLFAPHWQHAVLLVQWEVARRRAGIGGASMLTASWWPWYEFALQSRIPAHCFRPAPSVDGGLLTVTRRPHPLVTDRAGYQRFVKQIFTGPGRGVRDIVTRTGRVDRGVLRRWLRSQRVSPHTLPKNLTAPQWASLWHLITDSAESARSAPRRGTT